MKSKFNEIEMSKLNRVSFHLINLSSIYEMLQLTLGKGKLRFFVVVERDSEKL